MVTKWGSITAKLQCCHGDKCNTLAGKSFLQYRWSFVDLLSLETLLESDNHLTFFVKFLLKRMYLPTGDC